MLLFPQNDQHNTVSPLPHCKLQTGAPFFSRRPFLSQNLTLFAASGDFLAISGSSAGRGPISTAHRLALQRKIKLVRTFQPTPVQKQTRTQLAYHATIEKGNKQKARFALPPHPHTHIPALYFCRGLAEVSNSLLPPHKNRVVSNRRVQYHSVLRPLQHFWCRGLRAE